jgi:hypothetical protein
LLSNNKYITKINKYKQIEAHAFFDTSIKKIVLRNKQADVFNKIHPFERQPSKGPIYPSKDSDIHIIK